MSIHFRPIFKDRTDAGQKLSDLLVKYADANPLILALPRGGIVIAYEVSKRLGTHFDVLISRKLSFPLNPEYGIGAICEDGVPFLNPELSSYLSLQSPEVMDTIKEQTDELKRRMALYRDGVPLKFEENRVIIVVDDGLATGVTAAAAGRYLKKFKPQKLILAVPVAPKHIHEFVKAAYDEVISLYFLSDFNGVGEWYQNFTQVQDHDVLTYLGKEPLFL